MFPKSETASKRFDPNSLLEKDPEISRYYVDYDDLPANIQAAVRPEVFVWAQYNDFPDNPVFMVRFENGNVQRWQLFSEWAAT